MTGPLRKIAEGREAEIYEWEDDRVLRLLRNPDAQTQIAWELRAMQAARAAGVSVPAAYGAATHDGRPGLIMDRVHGLDLLTIVGKQPWRIWWVGRVTGTLQAALHEVVAPAELPSIKDAYRRRMAGSPLVPEDVRRMAGEVLDGLPDGDRLCHGDFHPGNVITTEREPAIIDWTNVTRGDPMADYARTLLMMRTGSVPPGSPLVIRIGAHGLRGLMEGSYAGAYRRARPVDAELAQRWETVVAANRLADDIPEERGTLLKLLARRMKER